MTREEAIYCLDHKDIVTPTEFWTAVGMAIEALKQPEIIRCKDCCFYAISKEKRSWCKDMLRRIQPEDFCSHARRQEE